ncbi:glycoside hydrolase family 2 TIM barrel-domain containing protein [Granulicella mallensis]|uniref:Beta-galactosidase n=1 Tax=Granulicella mallensis TaxID=940614 RepID=A0A7W8E904_9BACT|nr:glycoside hydrolase family 2 TIM barrel-domain containing protein [Granulicella mallensis]MBB5061850.1 beta-galactosidase [Granulicella mallensis]
MSPITRRDFLSDAAMAGAASALRLDASSGTNPEVLPERRTNFDRGWRFLLGDAAGAQAPGFHDAAWRSLDLPHDWSIEGSFDENAPAKGNGAYLPTGIGWYRKDFIVPSSAHGRRIALQFDGVYQRSEVWINGVSLGMRPYGFIGFSYDLTAHLAPPGKPNYLAVRVDNSLQTNCRWYSGSGIYRHTWLRITDPIHIVENGIYVRTPSITRESATVEVTTRLRNDSVRDADLELMTEILSPTGETVQQTTTPHTLSKDAETTLAQTLTVASPALWSTTTPHLYRARCTVRSRGAQIDQDSANFGIRQIAFDVDRGFLLNGEHVKMNGVCIHGDGGSVGTAVPERLWERRLELLQQMGCNAIRLSHNPPAPELLDMLDRMGFLVMAEAFDEWRHAKGQTPTYGYHRYFDEWSERDLTAMMERDRNHPSIVIWSPGNEVPDQTAPDGPATLQRLIEIIHSKDSTRPITVGCDQIAAEPKAAPPDFLDKLDVVGYNYVDRWRDRREKYYSIDRQAYPQRRFIGTESSALRGARGVYFTEQPIDDILERPTNNLIQVEQQQKFVQTYDYVSGDFLWVGIDYLGEAKWPNKLAVSGALDTCGFLKDSFYFYQSLWTKQPVLHLQPHWNWPGKEGKVIPVTCFTNCETVELFLNGESLGVKGYSFPRPGMVGRYGNYQPGADVLQTTADLHLTWDVPYAPGTLTAKGIKDGKAVEGIEVHTTGAPAKLALINDRQRLRTTPDDVAHITVTVQDAQGRIVPTADDAITFSLTGAGRILGVDNGQPDSHEPYKASSRRAFNGLALVLVQSNGRPGQITLSASSPSLASAQISIEAN